MKSRKKILFFTANIWFLLSGKGYGYGGSEVDLWKIAKSLTASNELDVEILAIADRYAKTHIDGVNLLLLPKYEASATRRGNFFKYALRLFNAVYKNSADWLFVKLPSSESFVVWLAAKCSNKKIVYRLSSNFETNEIEAEDKIFGGSKWRRMVYVFCLRHCTLVLAQTAFQQEAIQKNFGIKSKVIPNGVFIPTLPLQSSERNLILWIGRNNPDKRLDLFQQLTRRLPEEKFLGIISHENPTQINSLDKPDNLKWLHSVPWLKMQDYYGQAKILVMTSESEGWPNVIIEALAHQVAVVSYKVDPDGVLERNRIGICAHGNEEVFFNETDKIAVDSSLRMQYCKAGYDWVKKIDMDKIAQEYLKLFLI